VAAEVIPVRTAARAFFDTNILIYADDAESPQKQLKAVDLLAEHLRRRSGVVSIQVLQEYFAAALRKLNLDAGWAKQRIALFAKLQVVEPRVNSVLSAIDLHRIHQISFWDALILQSAKEAGCGVLLTEDLQHGQVIDGVRIVNPFV
jgi:predicted nucleic acid-binding protein